MKHFNYIFTGSGLAALMTVYKMAQSGAFKDKTILLLDENSKNTNDRTWCFWNIQKGIGNPLFQKNGIALLPMLILNAI
jgi:lycopene beta-cyclase